MISSTMPEMPFKIEIQNCLTLGKDYDPLAKRNYNSERNYPSDEPRWTAHYSSLTTPF